MWADPRKLSLLIPFSSPFHANSADFDDNRIGFIFDKDK